MTLEADVWLIAKASNQEAVFSAPPAKRFHTVRPDSHTALTATLFSVVQASGQISVHALVRGPESAQPRPFARCRALKGSIFPPPGPPFAPPHTTGPIRARSAPFATIPL